MDSKSRMLLKAITWQTMGFFMMLIMGYLMTGSLKSGGGFAAVTTVLGFVSYFGHEMLWSWVPWGRATKQGGRC
ncbi:MAG: DUF2061 domain-containing protein [Pseudomonadota bacterium]